MTQDEGLPPLLYTSNAFAAVEEANIESLQSTKTVVKSSRIFKSPQSGAKAVADSSTIRKGIRQNRDCNADSYDLHGNCGLATSFWILLSTTIMEYLREKLTIRHRVTRSTATRMLMTSGYRSDIRNSLAFAGKLPFLYLNFTLLLF